MRRVVITGMGAVTPYGRGVSALVQGLLEGRSAVRQMPELAEIGGLRTRVAATVEHVDGKEIARKFRRSMSAMSIFATLAAQEALTQAGVSRDRWT
ncbi:MAG: beta-ketoacyl synthase N-terminal-like domain-containing protein, partial [Thermovirgaceae bacterium]|nr:beta-ketoacyl synthase N-terminal-like domain-containing protein [Thermovirgaceae bacterium]